MEGDLVRRLRKHVGPEAFSSLWKEATGSEEIPEIIFKKDESDGSSPTEQEEQDGHD